jgi:polyisoprenoid-binding protein YceI
MLAIPPAAAPGAADPLDVDYERSSLVAKINKGGLLRFLGHEHGVVPGDWSAEVSFDPNDLAGSSIVVAVSAPGLIIDSEPARRLAGVDPDGPTEAEVEEIRAKMLSDEQLDAETFPVIHFESNELRLDGDGELQIKGTLNLHGVARPVEVDADLESDGPGYVVRGSFEIGQKDFGIEPVSIGGVVKVDNKVEIRFEIFASRR